MWTIHGIRGRRPSPGGSVIRQCLFFQPDAATSFITLFSFRFVPFRFVSFRSVLFIENLPTIFLWRRPSVMYTLLVPFLLYLFCCSVFHQLYCSIDHFAVFNAHASQQVLAEFCAQDEDGQTPLLFAARSGSGEVFRHTLEALLSRASPEKVRITGIQQCSQRSVTLIVNITVIVLYVVSTDMLYVSRLLFWSFFVKWAALTYRCED